MHFLNVNHAIETANRLGAVVLDGARVPKVRNRYRQALSRLRPIPVNGDGIEISFEDGPWGRYLLEHGTFEDIYTGVGVTDPQTRQTWTRLTREAIAYVAGLDAGLGALVDLLVTDVVLLASERTGGGSASTLPGLVCMSPVEGWTVFDFAETLVHETVHLNLFIADMMYGLYTLPSSVLAEDRYRVLSAVKIGQMRPLDKAFHAAVVAVPLMWMQHERGESTLVDLYTGSLREACSGLRGQRDVFSPYGRQLVDELAAWADSLDWEEVRRVIHSSEYAGFVPT